MEPEEIWAEIERRKDRARDLKLREELWLLYSSVLRGYADALANDAELIYPPIRESLYIARGVYQFTLRDIAYKVIYHEGKREKNSRIARFRPCGLKQRKTRNGIPRLCGVYRD
ncbi:MAG: hypothetical protein WBX18_05575 [Terracidiphilus sp.]